MPKIIKEFGVDFGPFQDDELFCIEKYQLYHSLGKGLKTVGFILLRNAGKNIILLGQRQHVIMKKRKMNQR